MSIPLLRDEEYEIKSAKSKEVFNISGRWLEVENLFRFHNTKPYVILAGSGGGKTTLCMDIIFKKAKEATAIYYVSETVSSTSNNIIGTLPNAVRSKCTIENLIGIWKEITNNKDYYYGVSQSNSTNSSSVNNLIKIYNTLVNSAGIKEDDKRWRKAIASHYPDVFSKVNVEITTLPAMIQSIGSFIEDSYFHENKKKIREGDPSESKKLEQINEEARHRGAAFIQETLQRMIVNIITLYPNTLKASSSNSLNATELNIISGFYSEKPKTMLIIDDCTDTLQAFSKSATKVTGLTGQFTPTKNAYTELMTSIFTRARHANCMVCIFTHMLSVIPGKDNIHNVILLDNTLLPEINRSHSVSDRVKEVFNYMNNRIFLDNKFKYCYVYFNEANDGNCVYVGKASLHIREEIEYNKLTKKYYTVYDSFNNDDQPVETTDVTENFTAAFKLEESSDDIEEDEDDDLNGMKL